MDIFFTAESIVFSIKPETNIYMRPPFPWAGNLLLKRYIYNNIQNVAAQLIHQMMNKVFWEQRYRFCVILVLDILSWCLKHLKQFSFCFSGKILTVLITSMKRHFWHSEFILFLHDLLLHLRKAVLFLYWYIQWKSWKNKATATKAKYKPNQNAQDNTNQPKTYTYHCWLPSSAFPLSSSKHWYCYFFEETS